MDFINNIIAQIPVLIATFGTKILAAAAILIIGFQIAKLVRRFAQRAVEKSSIDTTLGRFSINLIYYAALAFVLMATLDQLGVDTNSIVAIIGAAGLAAGLAMEGALANFVAGLMLIMLRPFKEDDYVEIADVMGKVEQIAMLQTRIITFENETVILPNRDVTDGKIINFSTRGHIELELDFFVDFEADVEQALDIIEQVADKSQFVVQEPPAAAHVLNMTETAIRLQLEANIMPENRERATFDLTKGVLIDFQKSGIKMPQKRWLQH